MGEGHVTIITKKEDTQSSFDKRKRYIPTEAQNRNEAVDGDLAISHCYNENI